MNTSRIKKIFVELAKDTVSYLSRGDASTLQVDTSQHAFIQHYDFAITAPLATRILMSARDAGLIAEEDISWSQESLLDIFLKNIIPFAKGESGDSEIGIAANTLLKELSKIPTKYEKVLSVFGFDESVSELNFGDINISLREQTFDFDMDPLFKVGESRRVHFASISIMAVDDQTAQKRARQFLEARLSVMNALCSKASPSFFKIGHRFEEPFELTMIGEVQSNGLWGGSTSSVRRFVPMSQKIAAESINSPVGQRVIHLLLANSEMASRTTAAYEIAGRACVERDVQSAFMLFAIALESAVMGKQNTGEITFQLATRIAHLISTSIEQRRSTVKSVKYLYGVRSKIVHAGKMDVTPQDIKQMREVCLKTLEALSELAVDKGVDSHEQLQEWFECKTLETSAN